MKVILLLLSIVAFIVITSKISRFLSKRVENIEKEIEEENKRNESFKEVLKKENCSSTSKPKDFNDVQNLDEKFSKNVYRDKSGKFKSKKEWKKKQKTS
jgi:predicted Holliday junction resolvase-like endonuclease